MYISTRTYKYFQFAHDKVDDIVSWRQANEEDIGLFLCVRVERSVDYRQT